MFSNWLKIHSPGGKFHRYATCSTKKAVFLNVILSEARCISGILLKEAITEPC
jgi:hypothetical protein